MGIAMIHYHGTPITPRKHLLEMFGKNFCVSFADPRDIEIVIKRGQSVMMDNGAFSSYTRNLEFKPEKFCNWVEKYLAHPHWAVIPDKIGGTVEEQRKMLKNWVFPKELSAPVFHLHLNLDWLLELADNFPKICLGSSNDYWKVGNEGWVRRMDAIFECLLKKRKHLPWIHGMRMLGQTEGRYPLASADSTNVARNSKEITTRNKPFVHPELLASKIDVKQTPVHYIPNPQKSFW
tara:strand:- start:73 stop:777 length:705 start_codon:yes stop_codon:yes gene_type:complete